MTKLLYTCTRTHKQHVSFYIYRENPVLQLCIQELQLEMNELHPTICLKVFFLCFFFVFVEHNPLSLIVLDVYDAVQQPVTRRHIWYSNYN